MSLITHLFESTYNGHNYLPLPCYQHFLHEHPHKLAVEAEDGSEDERVRAQCCCHEFSYARRRRQDAAPKWMTAPPISSKRAHTNSWCNFFPSLIHNLQRIFRTVCFLQGDTSRCAKPSIDVKTKVLFWPGLARGTYVLKSTGGFARQPSIGSTD